MGLISIENNGSIYVLGGEKVKDLYSSRKLVPVLIGSNLNNTAYNVMSVRLHAEQKEQLKEISKKHYRSELEKQASFGNMKAKNRLKMFKKEETPIVDTVVLSNQGYAYLKNETSDNKSMGCYWKSNLVKKGIISSSRRYDKRQRMSYAEYLEYKSYYPYNRAVYRDGCLCIELIASLSPIDLINNIKPVENTVIKTEVIVKKEVKGLNHLSFDMVAWWANN